MNYEEKYNEILEWARKNKARLNGVPIEEVLPELAESEDERIRKELVEAFEALDIDSSWNGIPVKSILAWLEKQKENLKNADSISADCTSNVKCEDRWHKVTDSLPDNGRLVLAKDCLGNVLLARYDGENWEVNVYDNEDHYCHNSISKWCEIPSEKQKDSASNNFDYVWDEEDCEEIIAEGQKLTPRFKELLKEVCHAWYDRGAKLEKQKEQKPWKVGANAYFTPEQKQEWSEEDEVMLKGCIRSIEEARDKRYPNECDANISYNREINWLKSLRPSWKPSEEQMKALHRSIYYLHGEGYEYSDIQSLYEELKKL